MFAIFTCLWLFVVLMALAILFWNAYGRAMYRRVRRGRSDRDPPSYMEKEPQFFIPEKMVKSPLVAEKGDTSFAPLQDAPPRRKFWSLNKEIARGGLSPDDAPPVPSVSEREHKSWDSILDHADVSASEELHRSKSSKLRGFFAKLKKGKDQSEGDYVQGSTADIDPWFPTPAPDVAQVNTLPSCRFVLY